MPDLTKGHTFATGDVVTAANLNSLLDDATINDDAITADMMAANSVKDSNVSSSAAISLTKLAKPTDGKIIVGRSSDGAAEAVALSGDATIIADGTLTVADDAITTDKIIDNAVDGTKIAMGSDAAGDILYYNGTDYVKLAKGASETVLKMNDGLTAPEWAFVAPNIEQTIFTGTKLIYNHSTSSYSSVEGTQGDEAAFYLLSDGTSDFDSTITRRALDSKVKIEFTIHIDTNTGRGGWGKIQRSLNDGTDWVDTSVGDVGPGGASDLRRSVQFGGAYINNAYSMEPVSLGYVDTPAGGTGEEAVRYRIIVGTQAEYKMYVNYDSNEGDAPSGNGGTHLVRTTSSMLLTEIPV